MNKQYMEIEKFDAILDEDSGYQDENLFYSTSSLLYASKKQKCTKFKHYLHSCVFHKQTKSLTAVDFAQHVQRVNAANLSFPIILTPNGWIADGYHRIAKAIIEKKKWVWAIRLNEMPRPTETTAE